VGAVQTEEGALQLQTVGVVQTVEELLWETVGVVQTEVELQTGEVLQRQREAEPCHLVAFAVVAGTEPSLYPAVPLAAPHSIGERSFDSKP